MFAYIPSFKASYAPDCYDRNYVIIADVLPSSGIDESGVNTLRQRQNGRHFPDDTFKCIFLNENASILIKISLNCVPNGPMKDNPAFVQIMAWRRPGAKPLSEQMLVNYWRIYASLGLNELMYKEETLVCKQKVAY